MGTAWTTVLEQLGGLLTLLAEAVAPVAGTWSLGVAIVLLTLLVRLALLPLGIVQARAITTRRALAPEVARITARFDTTARLRSRDPDRFARNLRRQQQAVRSLYRDHGVKASTSFAVALAQSPVLFTLYRLLNAPEVVPALATAPFAMISSLSASVVAGAGVGAIVLLGIIGLTTWYGAVQAGTSPAGPDAPTFARPARLGLVAAAAMTAVGATLPAGVLLYWATTGLVTVAQQGVLLR